MNIKYDAATWVHSAKWAGSPIKKQYEETRKIIPQI